MRREEPNEERVKALFLIFVVAILFLCATLFGVWTTFIRREPVAVSNPVIQAQNEARPPEPGVVDLNVDAPHEDEIVVDFNFHEDSTINFAAIEQDLGELEQSKQYQATSVQHSPLIYLPFEGDLSYRSKNAFIVHGNTSQCAYFCGKTLSTYFFFASDINQEDSPLPLKRSSFSVRLNAACAIDFGDEAVALVKKLALGI